jgi:hypothetical protein
MPAESAAARKAADHWLVEKRLAPGRFRACRIVPGTLESVKLKTPS